LLLKGNFKNMQKLHMIAFLLLIVGGLNWGLEAFGYGIGNFLPSSISMIIYVLVGLSAIVEIVGHKKNCKCCSEGCEPKAPTQQM